MPYFVRALYNTGMVVTEIKACEKNKGRVNIYIDGAFAFAVYAEIAVLEGIKKGAVLDDARIAQIKDIDAEKYAITYGLRFVSAKPRTAKEASDKLTEKGIAPDAVKKAVCKLAEYGYIDDENYAALYAEELGSKYGRHVIRQKMKQKGLPDELIEAAMEKNDGKSALKAQLDRYLHRFEGEESQKRRQKIVRALIAKGFDYGDIKSAMAGEDD